MDQRRFHFGDIYKKGVYKPLHSELFTEGATERWAEWLVPSFTQVTAKARESDPRPLLHEEAPGVYSFDLFTAEFCELLLSEVEHAEQTDRENLERPNGMNRYGIVLNQLGLEPIITALQQQHLLPLQAALYPEEGFDADDHHCFIVRYKAGEDLGLDMHEDDSDVTLNVCLGKEFTAATLSFCGLACDDDHRRLKHTYSHQVGRAVIHRGRHRHGADNIETGERVNFILWSTSGKYRASEAYHKNRMRSLSASPPDPICLSYTHDKDYTKHLQAPSSEEAIARGVMLDHVERRNSLAQRPVHDLSKPLDEINEVPAVCLFLEGLPPPVVQAYFDVLMHLSMDVRQGREWPAGKSPPMFYVAVQSRGAVPQVRALCGVQKSPGFAILDVQRECCHVFQGEVLDPPSMKDFLEAFLKGELSADPIGGAAASDKSAEEEASKQDVAPDAVSGSAPEVNKADERCAEANAEQELGTSKSFAPM